MGLLVGPIFDRLLETPDKVGSDFGVPIGPGKSSNRLVGDFVAVKASRGRDGSTAFNEQVATG